MRSTALGSVPGTDIETWTSLSLELFAELAFWPELPARGFNMIGRAVGVLPLPVTMTADGWRIDRVSGREQRRGFQAWRDEIEIIGECAQGYPGAIKLALTGPWTLAGTVLATHPTMDLVLADQGACREMAEALGDGIATLCAQIRAVVPNDLIIQLDEPLISAIGAGQLPSYSGLRRYRRPESQEIIEIWRRALTPFATQVENTWLHSCSDGLETELAAKAGFGGISLDLRHLDGQIEQLSAWLESGTDLALGAIPTHVSNHLQADEAAAKALGWLRRLKLDPEMLSQRIIITPACGLGTWAPDQAKACLAALPRIAEQIEAEIRS